MSSHKSINHAHNLKKIAKQMIAKYFLIMVPVIAALSSCYNHKNKNIAFCKNTESFARYETTMIDWGGKSQFDGVVIIDSVHLNMGGGFPDSNSNWQDLSSGFIENGKYYARGSSMIRVYYNFSLGYPDGDGFELERIATILAIETDAQNDLIHGKSVFVNYMEGMPRPNVYRGDSVAFDSNRVFVKTLDARSRPHWIEIENSNLLKVENDFAEMRRYWDSLKTLK